MCRQRGLWGSDGTKHLYCVDIAVFGFLSEQSALSGLLQAVYERIRLQ
jgi:hypothetical protein